MKKNSILVKSVLMSMLTAATYFGFTSCQDDVLDDVDSAPKTEEVMTRAITEGYNINDHNAIRSGEYLDAFDRKQWWSEDAIFLFVGGTGEQNIKGRKDLIYHDRSGYELQILPWSTTEHPHSNIPQAIIDDLVNDKNNWQLVLMQCGDDATKNGNYLGFYHKYRGILRILTYLKPGTLNMTNHMWGFSMGDELASHSVFGYALPQDKAGTVADVKTVLKMGERMNKTVTPMMSKMTWNTNGCLAPSEGWWAFDIDLSVYNPQADVQSSAPTKTFLSLQPLGYESTTLEFKSVMKAAANGTVKLEEYQASTDGDVAGMLMKGLDVVGKIAEFAGKCAEGDVAGAISGGVELAKTGCEIAGIGSETTGYQGDIRFDMDGTITTLGQQSKPVNFNEMPGVDLTLASFDFSGNDNTFGQGVWNLETAPVVYCTNAETNWKDQRKSETYDTFWFQKALWSTIFGPVKSPFGGLYQEYYQGGEDSGKPWHGLVCFFDPSSVKVSLNPQLFSGTEIQKAKVTAVCGVRKGTSFDRYEQYRTAQGLQSMKHHVNSTYQFPNRYTGETPFNAYGRGVHQFSADPVDKNEVGYIGGGDSDYLIEPVALRAQADQKWGDYYLPTYEVTVTVTIPLDNGKTLVLSRTYLPEIKDMDAIQVEDYFAKLRNGTIGMPAHYQENVYNEQVAHIGQLNHWLRSTPIAINGTHEHKEKWVNEPGCEIQSDSNEDHPLCSFARLIDGDKNSKWASHESNGKDKEPNYNKTVAKGLSHHCWFVEFKIYGYMKAKSFTLTSSNTGEDKKPRDIRLFARKDNQGEWVELFMQDGIRMPNGNFTEMTFNIPSDKQGCYNTYRFEVGRNWGGNFLDLNELTMNWAE